jgi:flagellar motor component MotA
MQIIGVGLLFVVVTLGFMDRGTVTVSAFDPHAIGMILLGCLGAVMAGSHRRAFLTTFSSLRELIPGFGKVQRETMEINAEREKFYELWRNGKRAEAAALAERSRFPSTQELIRLVAARSTAQTTAKVFSDLRDDASRALHSAGQNWEMMAKLGPSFGMVGTITGMIQLFKNLGTENANVGAAMSLALLATLYGVAFGAGIAGPIGHYLAGLLDERLGVLDSCERTANDLIASHGG